MKTLKGCIGLLLALLLTETSYAATLTLTAADYQRIDKHQFDASWWYRTTFNLDDLKVESKGFNLNTQHSKLNTQHYELTVSNPSSEVAFFLRLVAKDANDNLVCPAYWTDNYLTLAPGESRTVGCDIPTAAPAGVHFEISGSGNMANYDVLPLPQKVEKQKGEPFVIEEGVEILAPASLHNEAELLRQYIKECSKTDMPITARRMNRGRRLHQKGTTW